MDGDRTEHWVGRGIVVDASRWPILVERMPVQFPNDDDAIDAWIAHVDALMASKASPFVMIVDSLATTKTANARSRRRMSEWLSSSADYQKHCLGAIFVVGSPLVRGALMAIHWITRPTPSRTIAGSWDEAVAEARVLLARAGIAMPPGFDSPDSETA